MFPGAAKLSSLDGHQEGFMWSKKFCHVSNVLVYIVLHLGDVKQSSEPLVFKCMYPAFCVREKLRSALQDTTKGLREPVIGGEADGASCSQHALSSHICHRHDTIKK
ncbi:hypothetical protein DPMN_069858 [Dreissena polymorpha]|uniref:Uncharacterized protein n=1 Tax=Dreissena polymorpha TaxID=45954 RepID=A0A9D3Z4C5_DREPO|nr:hypothetical protein DPMN_069858 [Dreissena polymorpha]